MGNIDSYRFVNEFKILSDPSQLFRKQVIKVVKELNPADAVSNEFFKLEQFLLLSS
jgi:hypothetical protein